MQEQIQFSKKAAVQYIQAGKYRQARAILQNIAMQDDEALAMLQRLNTIEATPAPRKGNPVITILALMGAIALVCIVAVVFLPEIELPQSTSNKRSDAITSPSLVADLIKTELLAQGYDVTSVTVYSSEVIVRGRANTADYGRMVGAVAGVTTLVIDSSNVNIDQPATIRLIVPNTPELSFSYRSAQQLVDGEINAAQFLVAAQQN